MNEPNEDEINRRLAKYMCCAARQFKIKGERVLFSGNPEPHKFYDYGPLYTKSLDALVPVVKKLLQNHVAEFALYWNRNGVWAETFHMIDSMHITSEMHKSPGHALALAIYKVINHD